MFGKKKQPPIRTLIGEGTVIQGELRFTDGLRIDGEVQGDVVAIGRRKLDARHQRESPGQRQGERGPRDHQWRGLRAGPVGRAARTAAQGAHRGDVRYELLEMHQGATIDGELRPLKAEEKPALIKLATRTG